MLLLLLLAPDFDDEALLVDGDDDDVEGPTPLLAVAIDEPLAAAVEAEFFVADDEFDVVVVEAVLCV